MVSDVVKFPARTRGDHGDNAPIAQSLSNRGAQPVVNLSLLMRGAGADLQPRAVALALLKAKSNNRAAPIWIARREAFKDLIHARGIRGLRAENLYQGWRDLVRAEGVAEKAKRRQEQEQVFRMFEQMALDPRGDTA